MQNKLFIPKNIRVGFQNRSDTYTKKLAYVIYYDEKGKIRKETSWENWRDKKIDPLELDNEPSSGFVLNKGVGGVRQSYGWNARNEYIRVYDPRGFEFEISVANLLFILQECTSTKGKGLEGNFVYAWSGKELVLLPTSCQEYEQSTNYTKLQDQKITVKDMVPGCAYTNKKQQKLIYMGRFMWHTREVDYKRKRKNNYSYDYKHFIKSISKKRHVFYIENKEDRDWNNKNHGFIDLPGFTTLATKDTTESVSNFAELMENLGKIKETSVFVDLIIKPIEQITQKDIDQQKHGDKIDNKNVYRQESPEKFTKFSIYRERTYRDGKYTFLGLYVQEDHKLIWSNKELTYCDTEYNRKERIPPKVPQISYWEQQRGKTQLKQNYLTIEQVNAMKLVGLYGKLESGIELPLKELLSSYY